MVGGAFLQSVDDGAVLVDGLNLRVCSLGVVVDVDDVPVMRKLD